MLMNDFLTNTIISNPGYFFLLFLGFLLICHLFILAVRPGKIGLIIIDYIWLSIAAIGLMTLVSDVRVSIAKNWVKIEESSAKGRLELLQSRFGSPENTYLCMEITSLGDPGEDFYDYKREYDLRCEWLKGVYGVLTVLEVDSLPKMGIEDFPIPTFSDPELIGSVHDLNRMLEEYELYRSSSISTRDKLSKNGVEETFFYFSPFLLAFALALRISKVTSELISSNT